jgi:hypothetical protein
MHADDRQNSDLPERMIGWAFRVLDTLVAGFPPKR